MRTASSAQCNVSDYRQAQFIAVVSPCGWGGAEKAGRFAHFCVKYILNVYSYIAVRLELSVGMTPNLLLKIGFRKLLTLLWP